MYGSAARGVNCYAKVGVQSALEDASPHRLIQMLLDGTLARIAAAKGAVERQDIPEKGRLIGKCMDLVIGLRNCLDLDNGGELAESLDALYEYMLGRLLEANRLNDAGILQEVADLLNEIKEGWDGIAPGAQLN